MRKYFFILFATFASMLSARNLMHYAESSDGEMAYTLFPMKNGAVYVSDTIRCNADAEEIAEAVDSYILSMQSYPGIKVKEIGSTRKRQSYKVEMDFAKAPLNITVWGSPVAIIDRDASTVKFTLSAIEKDSLCIVTLNQFETNRTTLRGAAKNDGDPNIIHWQRVNSLTREMQEEIGNKTGIEAESIRYDYAPQIAFEHFLYANEARGIECLIKGFKENLSTERFGEVEFTRDVVPPYYSPIQKKEPIPYDKSTFKGNLLAPGNNVMVVSGNTSHERAGAAELAKQITLNDYWIVTEEPEKAHFIIGYYVDTEGRDKAYITITDGDGNREVRDFPGSKTGSSESDYENREVARKIFKKAIKPIYKSASEGKNANGFSQYYIR